MSEPIDLDLVQALYDADFEVDEHVPALIAELRETRRRLTESDERNGNLFELGNKHLDTIDRIKAADPDLFDPDEHAEDKVYETYGSNGRYLREDFLAALEGA